MARAVLVTGGGGFVGSAIVRRLVAAFAAGGVRVGGGAIVDRVVATLSPGGSRERLEELRAAPTWEVASVDLADANLVDALLDRVRPLAVIHTALDRAVYHEVTAEVRETRVVGPLAYLVRGLRRAGGLRFVHAGSSWVLPGGPALDEDTLLTHGSAYASAKALQDRLLPELARDQGVEWVNLRLFNLFGRYERPERLIPYLVGRLGSGCRADLSVAGNVRDFTDVDLAAEAFVLALVAPSSAADRLFHVGTGRGTSIARMAELVTEVVGRGDLVRFERRPTADSAMEVQVADISRARRVLGWNPPDDLETRVRATARWWIHHLGVQPAAASFGRTAS